MVGMVRSRRWLLVLGLGGLVLAAGCAYGSGPVAAPSRASTTPRSHMVVPLSPSVPGLFRTGINACGNPYLVNATTRTGTIPLVDCPGWAGLNPTPMTHLAVGDELTIAGVPARASLTIAPAEFLSPYGTTFLAIHPGTTVITIHDFGCVPDQGGSQPTTCPLVKVQVG